MIDGRQRYLSPYSLMLLFLHTRIPGVRETRRQNTNAARTAARAARRDAILIARRQREEQQGVTDTQLR